MVVSVILTGVSKSIVQETLPSNIYIYIYIYIYITSFF